MVDKKDISLLSERTQFQEQNDYSSPMRILRHSAFSEILGESVLEEPYNPKDWKSRKGYEEALDHMLSLENDELRLVNVEAKRRIADKQKRKEGVLSYKSIHLEFEPKDKGGIWKPVGMDMPEPSSPIDYKEKFQNLWDGIRQMEREARWNKRINSFSGIKPDRVGIDKLNIGSQSEISKCSEAIDHFAQEVEKELEQTKKIAENIDNLLGQAYIGDVIISLKASQITSFPQKGNDPLKEEFYGKGLLIRNPIIIPKPINISNEVWYNHSSYLKERMGSDFTKIIDPNVYTRLNRELPMDIFMGKYGSEGDKIIHFIVRFGDQLIPDALVSAFTFDLSNSRELYKYLTSKSEIKE